MSGWVFLAAYTCSGIAGLIYQVTWARLFGLYLGHTTAAASTVLAVFMGGLCGGALLAGRYAIRLAPRVALRIYAVLESIVLIWAIALPSLLQLIAPELGRFYHDGNTGALFMTTRLLVCASVLVVPTLSLGATFPLAVRWFIGEGGSQRRSGGALYVANTLGAAAGSLSAGFIFLPGLGHFRTTLVGAAATSISILVALLLARHAPPAPPLEQPVRRPRQAKVADVRWPHWVAAVIVSVTGFATFVLEIVWMRLLAMVIGPSIYAFSATVAMFITAIAAGGLLGETWLQRTGRRQLALAMALALAAAGGFTMWAASYAGSSLPHQIASGRANWLQTVPADAIVLRFLLAASIVAPGALALGAVFPLAIEMAGGRTAAAASRIARIYGVNAVASVAGAMAAGFSLIPLAGLEPTIRIASSALVGGALVIVFRVDFSRLERVAIVAAVMASIATFVWAPRWDHELLASGLYRPDRRQLSIEEESGLASLRAGTLLYYREGSTGTVSVKQSNGTLSLAIDGKVDASTSGDMLTQKLLAHLPLLMHERPRTVGIIGLGSGVTLASALVHPVARVDVVELSPEVVEASNYFAKVNAGALSEPRTRLIVGDGRTHLLLTQQRYDVIVSEPSNPWMAGVATLFTREFFQAARNRLAPGGILCQWTHTYNMTDRDLRSIIATFVSVFPRGTMWRIGDGDLLLVASPDRELPLAHIETAWHRPGVTMDLATVSAHEPFSVLSMFGGGTAYLQAFARGAELQTDDRLALEFSGPLAVLGDEAPDSRHTLTRPGNVEPLPPPIARALASAGADQWQRRGAMMRGAEANETAYEDFARAIAIEPSNQAALDGLVEAAIATSKGGAAERVLRSASTARPHGSAPWIALSRLQASLGRFDEAIASATTAYETTSRSPEALEQLASVHADLGDAPRLMGVVELLQRLFPDRRATYYYTAATEFLMGRLEPALSAIDRAIAIDPAYAQAHNLRGAVQARRGRVEDAKAAFAAGLSLNPRDSAIYNNYGLLELELGNRDAAAGLFREALALDPTSQVSRQGLIEARLTSR